MVKYIQITKITNSEHVALSNKFSTSCSFFSPLIYEFTIVLFHFIFKVEYRLKWKDYPTSQNCWVPIEMMKCPDLVNEFEIARFSSIVGMLVQIRKYIFICIQYI